MLDALLSDHAPEVMPQNKKFTSLGPGFPASDWFFFMLLPYSKPGLFRGGLGLCRFLTPEEWETRLL
ncbi:hypothetical protein VTK56DRAFT_4074 [Thermocarpiscus australiensis]